MSLDIRETVSGIVCIEQDTFCHLAVRVQRKDN
jgi:hypothetical protein